LLTNYATGQSHQSSNAIGQFPKIGFEINLQKICSKPVDPIMVDHQTAA